MELLSELAELERPKHHDGASHGEELLTFDLQSLATLAAARALEMEPQEGVAEGTGRHCPVRRTLNLRRKCTWTPRHEPVFPVKGAMETMDGPELAMRVRLAELQRRYKEKQRELAKLQRKHEHQKEETPRSPARRGPGRPRKRKSTPGPIPGAVAPADSPRRVKSLGGLGLLPDDLRGGGETQRKKRRLSNGSFDQLSTVQMKGRCCKQNGRQGVLGSKLAQFKQRPKTAVGPAFRRRGNPGSSVAPARLCQRGSKAEQRLSVESGGQSDTEEDDDDCSYDSEEGQGDIKTLPSKDTSSSLAMTGPSPSSIVKLEANQKARNKKERQGLHGSRSLAGVEGEVKVKMKMKKSALCRPPPLAAARREPQGVRRKRGPKPKPLQQLWGRPGPGSGPYRRSAALSSLPTASERLKRATRKSTALRGLPGTRRSCWIGGAQSPSSEENSRGRRSRNKQPKGRAVSRLLESFAADEGFQMDEDGSFSEGEGESGHSKRPSNPPRSLPAAPDCVLTRERLADGLKVLISKEDELLYAATVRTLELPDIYSVVIDGERGNRPRIYSLEQLLQEAVLDVRPESELMLPAGTRVCAYWSERSRCLYPGYVRRGGAGEEGKEGSVMVEFDDGDRGRISLPNIRLLPPDYQIHCAEPSPALLVSGRRGRRCSAQEKSTPGDVSSEKPDTEAVKPVEKTAIHKARRGRPKGSGKKNPPSDFVKKCSAPLFSWPAVAAPRKRTPHDLFQLNGGPRRPLKGRDLEAFPLLPAPVTTPAKAIFSSSFEVDSFSSIANGYSSFGRQPAALPPVASNSAPCSRGRRLGEGDAPRCRKTGGAEFLVKLDHEGVTAPKTKNSKALLLLGATGQGGGRVEKGFGGRGVSRPVGYSHPVLLVKDSKSGDGTRVELLLKGSSPLRKPAPGPAPGPALSLGEYTDFGISCHSDCHSSYSDMDEEEDEEEEEEERRALAAAAAASGGLRTAGRFLSPRRTRRAPRCSCRAASPPIMHCCSPPSRPPPQRAFVAKAVAVTRGGAVGHGIGSKPLKRKPCPAAPAKNAGEAEESADLPKRHRLPPSVGHPVPKISSFLPPHQLWRWSGNATQRRGLKGKARKLFYKAIVRGRDTVRVGDCAIFLSTGRPHLPYVGRIENFWESWASMVVKVKWFYHPEETKMGKRHRDGKHALYQSCHEDENDVQTISHRCQVVSREEYERLSHDRKHSGAGQDLYYLAGTYDPTSGQLVNADGVSILC
ncbi:hypothetical protein SKAU_G00300730 [Synaphobranchus kaupii]|uniref:BAH domain-containing protein n=1 Tax=Synaphobranchus kaupii TaxID=118154 RepID=A0A9Q1IL47_SYNKA|nr:hypothetical protein SKAU_G00300730 [Synaphobranchus kaupii]